jgi:hypothetical protein
VRVIVAEPSLPVLNAQVNSQSVLAAAAEFHHQNVGLSVIMLGSEAHVFVMMTPVDEVKVVAQGETLLTVEILCDGERAGR